MILLSVNQVVKHYGPEPVLSGVSFEIRSGDHVSLVGPNGAGKTTLLRILTGQQEADQGQVQLHSQAKIGFLQQHAQFTDQLTVFEEARSALHELCRLVRQSEELAEQISQATDSSQRQQLNQRFDRIQHELQQRDGYEIDYKIERVLTGLGFTEETYQQPASQLSGGQQNRLMLAKLLLESPDLMLLDEPSNHLDLEATRWLENFLIESRCAYLIVSHDRYFLDRVSTRTLELFDGTVDSYPGNFTKYQQLKVERLEVQRRTFDKQQTEIAKLEDFVRRHHYGQKHAQAEDRRKKLERIELVARPREIAGPPMSFPNASRSGDVALRVVGASKGFSQPLFNDLTFDVLRGEKWGIMGPNGTGKTTLLKCLLGLMELDQGTAKLGTGVKVGYFDQQLRCIDGNQQAVDAVRPDHKEFFLQQRRDLLARFGITGDMVFQTVESLSGGERNRVALSHLASLDANFFVLDEPTNHLDLWSRAALESALTQFDGTLLFVSHDRYFLNQVADHLLVVQPDRFRVIEGNYETYLHLTQVTADTQANTEGNAGGRTAGKKKNNRPTRAKPAKPKRRFPYRKVAEIEEEIAEHEEKIAQVHQRMILPEVVRDGDRVKQCQSELVELQSQLSLLYEHWEEATELN